MDATLPTKTLFRRVHDATERSRADAASEYGKLFSGRDFRFDSGASLSRYQIAYQTYGTLNADKSNAVFICHALTLDQFVTGVNPIRQRPGWWTDMVGPGAPIDTDRYFVICSNILGGCMGSSGPMSIDERTGKPYGLSFPLITIGDIVRAQKALVDELGIRKLLCVVGGSMGGMQVLQWAAAYPDCVFSALVMASSFRHTAQNIAFHELGRQAVMADPDWRSGNYLIEETRPAKGLAVARMAAHITYLSEGALNRKFGRKLQSSETLARSLTGDFQIESYLRYQGSSFVERFDANSYLYLTRAMDYFDLSFEHQGLLGNAFRGSQTRFFVISFSSDWLFPTSESRTLVRALNATAQKVSFIEMVTDKGHDAFLLDVPGLPAVIRAFVSAAEREQSGRR